MSSVAVECGRCKHNSKVLFISEAIELKCIRICDKYPEPEGVPSYVSTADPAAKKPCPEFESKYE
jgi:hypothetical protein